MSGSITPVKSAKPKLTKAEKKAKKAKKIEKAKKAKAKKIAKIEKDMRTDRKAYNGDEKKQARYRELIEAREKLKARS